jgi:hypothetical protein
LISAPAGPDFAANHKTFFGNINGNKLNKAIRSFIPKISKNIKGVSNYARLNQELLAQSTSPRVLVIGGGILGEGMESFAENPAIDLVESDVSFGPRTMMIFDAAS